MNRQYITSGVVALGLLMGCSTSSLDKVNPNQVTTDTFYQNASQLVSGVNSVYSIWQSFNLTGREWFFVHDLRSDDHTSGGGQLEGARNQILIGAQNPGNPVSGSVWNGLYRSIHRANVIITKGPEVTDNATLTKRVIAEAKFLRALAYFDLVTLWGGVPLYTEFVTAVDGTKARATVDEVYAAIIADLTAAQTDLPASYSGSDVGRATSGAASALLGRVYMQRGDYTNARTQFQRVISSGLYKLMDEYIDNFTEESKFNSEGVFEIGFSRIGDFNWDGDGNEGGGANETNTRSQEYNPIGWRNLIPSANLLADFEHVAKGDAKTDPRLQFNFYFIGDRFNNNTRVLADGDVQGNAQLFNGVTQKVSWRKYTALYKNAETYYTSGINLKIIRYADVLLGMAECENEAGNLAGAIALLNQVRARPSVAMPAYPTARYPVNSRAEVLRAIQHERRVKLAGEWARNRDILRWRAQNKLTTEPISYFARNRQEFLPIPQGEIDNNTRIGPQGQNPGY